LILDLLTPRLHRQILTSWIFASLNTSPKVKTYFYSLTIFR